MMSRFLYGLSIILLSGFWASGCMKMGPDFKTPELPVHEPEAYQHAPYKTGPDEISDRWWEVFGDSELDRLVENVLEYNLDIKAASAGVLAMKYQVVQTRAARFPAIGLQGQVQRQRTPETMVAPGITTGGEKDSYSLTIPASFELDLWGKLARAEEAARAELLKAEENRQTLAQGLVSEAISLYLKMESLERRIQITEQSLVSYQEAVSFVEARYKRGLTSILDLRQARRTLAQAMGLLPAFRQELGITQQALAVLVGKYPKSNPPRKQPEDYYKQLEPVPPGLPSQLLLRRPDIKAAVAGLESMNAQIGAAKASRFPSISLTGSYGYSSPELGSLFFGPEGLVWNIAAGFLQPLFDAGRLKAAQRGAEAQYEQSVAQYDKTVLIAFSEVENALLTRKEQLERRKEVLGFLVEARATQRVAEARYLRGLVDYLTVLNAQQTRFRAEDDLVLVDLAIFSNRVSLHRALGGGWAELPPVEGKETEGISSYLLW